MISKKPTRGICKTQYPTAYALNRVIFPYCLHNLTHLFYMRVLIRVYRVCIPSKLLLKLAATA
jgi:hypothetical protein